MVENQNDITSFACLNGRPLFREVVKKISKNIDFEQKFIQPLANSLTERHSLSRTISIPTCAYYNIRNILTAPFRLFNYQWATKTIFKPCYQNPKTGTMITSFAQQLGTNNTITHLLITQENSGGQITVPVKDNNLETITNIQANKTESVFICRSKDKTIVIVLDTEKPVIDQEFIDCVFSDTENELYAIKERQFGSFNIEKNEFTSLINLQHKTFTDIKINKKGTFVALCLDRKEIFIVEINESTNIKKLNLTLNGKRRIDSMCLHPLKDILYYGYGYGNSKYISPSFYCIDINTQELSCLPAKNIKTSNCLQFLPGSNDILFFGSETEEDYFLNTETNHFWSKKKNKSNERLIKVDEKRVNNAYERLMLTADGKQSIEQIAEGNFFIDFIALMISKDQDPLNFSTTKITAAPLINDTVIEAVNKINNGFLPPAIISMAQNNDPHLTPELKAQLNNLTPNMQQTIKAADTSRQWKLQWAKNIFYGLTFASAIMLKAIITTLSNLSKSNKDDNKKIEISEDNRAIAQRMLIGIGAAALMIPTKIFIERTISQY